MGQDEERTTTISGWLGQSGGDGYEKEALLAGPPGKNGGLSYPQVPFWRVDLLMANDLWAVRREDGMTW